MRVQTKSAITFVTFNKNYTINNSQIQKSILHPNTLIIKHFFLYFTPEPFTMGPLILNQRTGCVNLEARL